MGSGATLARQSALLVALMAALAAGAWAGAGPGAGAWCALAGAVALAFFLAVSWARHRQIGRLTAEIDEVLHDGRRVGFTTCREGDVAVLTNELGKMVARLARTTELLEREKVALADALADVSHQIRTPLTAVGLMLPGIEAADDPQRRKRAVCELESLLDRVSWLVTTLLKIAKADAGAMPLTVRSVAAADVARRAVAPLATAMDLRDVALALDLDEAASFRGDARWTAEAVENIVKNCVEHTPPGGEVRVSVSEDALATTIAVSDTGPGIAPEDLPHVFERFYRGRADAEAAPGAAGSAGGAAGGLCAPGGFGIGLALAQALVSAQGGTLRAANGDAGGARFTLSFPKLVV